MGKDGSVNRPARRIPSTNGHTLAPHPAYQRAMAVALEAAAETARAGDIPVGAVVLHMVDGEEPDLLASAANARERSGDPTAHAEILALRAAAEHLGRWRLDDCVLVVTLEPCPMCAGAAWAARLGGVVFGAVNSDAGATGSLYHLGQDPRLNHEFPTLGGVRAQDCAGLLNDFFASRR